MIDMDKISNFDIQIIEIQKGNTLNQKPGKTEWDKMSEAMKQLVDLFFLERSIFKSKDPLDILKKYIKEHDRLLYTVLSDAIYESFIKTEEKEALILGNIDYLLDLCNKDIEESSNLNNKKELQNKKIARKVALKIKDHTNLAIRQYRSLKQTDEEYNRKFKEQIGVFKEKLTQDITSQLITLVGIFTAIAFVVFGGISSLGSIFSDINKKSIIKLIISSSIWGIAMFNLIFGFLLGISKMTGLNISNSNSRDFIKKYLLVFWMNAIMITILVVSLWLHFMFKLRILEELFFPMYKRLLFFSSGIFIIITTCCAFRYLISKTKISK